jgi:hypothetical protein
MAEAKFVNREKILARLRRLPGSAADAAREQLKIEVDALVAAEQRACPVQAAGAAERPPGELRNSIHSYETEGRVASYRLIADAKDDKGTLYGRYVEFGHTAGDGSYVPAEPFWFSTYRAFKKGMVSRIKAAVRRRLKSEFPEGFNGY